MANVGGENDNQVREHHRLGLGCRPGRAIGHCGITDYGPAPDVGDLYAHTNGNADLYPDGNTNTDMDTIPNANAEQHANALPHAHHHTNADAHRHTNTCTSLNPSLARAPDRT